MSEVGLKRSDPVSIAVGVLLLGVAAVVWWDMTRLELSSTYGLGPKAMPATIAIGLVLLAVANFVIAIRGDVPEREPADPRALMLILGGFAVLIALIGVGGGFIPGVAVLFATTAAAFGRKGFLIDLLIGLALGIVIELLFAKFLSLSLPEGPIERLF